MNKSRYFRIGVDATLAVLGGMHYSAASYHAEPRIVIPANMPRIGTVDERFHSYNVEMVEVIGGRFWKPYKDVNALLKKSQPSAKQPGSNPVGMDPNLYQYRPPIDLSKPRLRRLAAALGPAYVRVSGTWANTTYFQDSDTPAPASPPKGFNGVLTRRQWKGVVDFSRAVDAKIVTRSPQLPAPATPPVCGLPTRQGSFSRTQSQSVAVLLPPSS
jgi:heparanase